MKRVLLFLLLASCLKQKSERENTQPPPQAVTQTPYPTETSTITNQTPTLPQSFVKPRFPIVLLQGFMGGKFVGKFADAKSHLEKQGIKVLEAEVSPSQSSEVRAGEIKTQIDSFLLSSQAEKVHLIAHSQGGLDARYLISTLKYGPKIASLTTLGTPHRGTYLADFSLQYASDQAGLTTLLNLLANLNGLNTGNDVMKAVQNMTENFVDKTFNPANPDDPKVEYYSYAAQTGKTDSTHLSLKLGYTLLKIKRGENDGVVPVDSARYGQFRGIIEADHLDLIGFQASSTFSHLKLIDDIISFLAKERQL